MELFLRLIEPMKALSQNHFCCGTFLLQFCLFSLASFLSCSLYSESIIVFKIEFIENVFFVISGCGYLPLLHTRGKGSTSEPVTQVDVSETLELQNPRGE